VCIMLSFVTSSSPSFLSTPSFWSFMPFKFFKACPLLDIGFAKLKVTLLVILISVGGDYCCWALTKTLDFSSSPCGFISWRAKDLEPWQLYFLKSTTTLV
jgi:hypothetical protein